MAILQTLKEALLFYVRYFWLVILAAALSVIPSVYDRELIDSQVYSNGYLMLLVLLVRIVISLSVFALQDAVILGLLSRPPGRMDTRTIILKTIENYFWTLFRLECLIGMLAMAVSMLGLQIVERLFGHIKFFFFILPFINLIFMKYALAAPLVVVESLGAWIALWQSWKMTKGHFGFVAGCYIIIAGANWLVWHVGIKPELLVDVCNYAFDPFWIIVSWCMYKRIKALENELETTSVPFTQSPPKSTSAP